MSTLLTTAESGCLLSKGKQLRQVLIYENRSLVHLLNPSITKLSLHSCSYKLFFS